MAGGTDRGRRAFERQSWSEAYDGLAAAAERQPLDAEDLERLAIAAYFVGRDGGEAWEQAHQVWLRLGDHDRAARCAFWLGFELLLRGEGARANGWFNRGRRVVADSGVACAAHGYLLVPAAMEALATGDAARCGELYQEVLETAERFDDPDLLAIGRLGRAEAAIGRGDVETGLTLLDEVMVSATTGEVSTLTAGILYCATVDACMQAFDLRRAAEWTEALTQWCDRQTDLVPFRGECLVHRSQILQAHGEWQKALAEATSAEELLMRSLHPAAGVACYQRGELHRVQGDHDAAEQAYRQASQHGREPAPGLALLRMAEGRVDAAVAAIERLLDEAKDPPARFALLPAAVEIRLAASDLDGARAASGELEQVAARGCPPFVDAVVAHCSGVVLLARADPAAALSALRRACRTWRELGVPYECARSQEQAGLACRALGDRDAGDIELDAARAVFDRLGALTDAARVAGHLEDPHPGGPAPAPTPLSERECEVLRFVAAGQTNRAIGTQLLISEHTVARHVQNIFTKLGVSSRAAATAYAYEHDIV